VAISKVRGLFVKKWFSAPVVVIILFGSPAALYVCRAAFITVLLVVPVNTSPNTSCPFVFTNSENVKTPSLKNELLAE
jgi:hypothetical protein